MLNKIFGLDPAITTPGKEIAAGTTTFLTMSYILFVNPVILSDAGMDFNAVITATALAAAFGTLLMAFWARVPFAMAPGMGLNAFFAYTLVIGEGISWQTAMGIVFVSGVVFLLLSVSGFRSKIVQAIPLSLRISIPVGIGLFITFIGFQSMGLVVQDESTIISLGPFGPGLVLGLIGLVFTAILEARKVKGAILAGIFVTTLLAIVTGQAQWITSFLSMPPSIAPVAFELDIISALQWGFAGAIFSFMFVDLFDSVGSIVACSYEADMVSEDGTIRNIDTMLQADALATIAGSLAGTSTTTTYIESATGIEAGGRSGLTAAVTALLFLGALFFTPIIGMVPEFATAPALVIVGVYMFKNIKLIPTDNLTELVPAFLVIVLMPLTYSISLGLTFGFIAWILMKLAVGDYNQIHVVMWFIGFLSVLNLIVSAQ